VGPADAPLSTPLKTAISELARSGGRRGKGWCSACGRQQQLPVQDLDTSCPIRFAPRAACTATKGRSDRWIAAHPEAITVSASTSQTRSAFSSWGKQISVCAPSDNWERPGPGQGPSAWMS